MEKDYTVFLGNTDVVKFRYTLDQEDASDAPVIAVLEKEQEYEG